MPVFGVILVRIFPHSDCIQSECGKMLSISPNSAQMQENADQNNSEYGHFLRSVHFLLINALLKILAHSKTIKSAKNLSAVGENDFFSLSDFLETHIFWNFDSISRAYNEISPKNLWFTRVITILIWRHRCLFFMFFEKDLHLNTVEHTNGTVRIGIR